MSRYFISLGLFLGATTDNVSGQSNTPIQLDRPDQTECPFIVPKGFIQMENGFTFENTNQNSQSFNFPSTLWKFGVNEKLELRLITEPVWIKENNKTSVGVLPITIGFKTSLCEERGLIPKTSFIGHIATSNIGSKQFNTTFIAPAFRFTMQHTLTNKITLAYNLGAEWDGESAEPTYIYTLTSGISLTEKLGCYLELYGFIPNSSKADHRLDGGLTYLMNNNFIVDLSGGVGLTESAPNNYISLGISYRFKITKK
jgi:hypothetical protein